ncbi:10741_t:CDS:2 [Acaulospora morrowiae]|uniref:10741_t:CDS:1 n=1 Tax=Acaulospora morrowiae TaxID=94023 RepID=A0A9N9BKD3_9GLOM|nr:10741_t:CDS:2 [Acaulospora morrowiae]
MLVERRLRYITASILGIPLIILTFLCPIIELLKFRYFNQIPGELSLSNVIIEYCYLVVSFSIPCSLLLSAISNYCRPKALAETMKEELFPVLFIWVIVAAVYTIITANEMHEIPANCPSPETYFYEKPYYYTACRVRLTNLISMWLFVLFGGLWVIGACLGILPKDNDLKRLTGQYEEDGQSLLW